jgi:hypothetical protein
MFHLVYTSYAAVPFSEESLIQLLKQSRAYNKQKNITGILIHLQDKFIQVLEGKKATVLALYHTIENDPRHMKVVKVIEGNSPQRLFKDWSMGFKELSTEEVENLCGFKVLDIFFSKQMDEWNGNLVMTYLKLFYNKNMEDNFELSGRPSY